MAVLAFIPARGGSKGIPGKNLYPLRGKPLIQYTVEAARQSAKVDEIFLSSDDPAIIDFCKGIGLEVPYVRPAELAGDASTIHSALRHALDWLAQKRKALPKHLLLLQPTSPLRTAADIDGAIERYLDSGADSLMSVHAMVEHPYECLQLNAAGWSYLSRPAGAVTRRQDYDGGFYFINGAIYLARTEFFLRTGRLMTESETALYVMPRERGIDIDDLDQMRLAEFFLGNADDRDLSPL
jgi:N-acylneuraminate cytidylyltransferase/CMP-N,N'-diacetyllegionaminic acid synthase